MIQTNVPKVPEQIAVQLEVLYQALAKCPDLLRQGRIYGLRVGLTADVVALIKQSHGEAANAVIANCLPIAGK